MPAMPVWMWLVAWMAAWVGIPVYAHHAVHGVVNGWHIALCFFLAINILICLWEISLGLCIGDIERWHHGKPSGAQRGEQGAQRGEAERRSDEIAERRSDEIAERRSDENDAKHERPRGSVFLARVGPGQLFSPRLWARVWSEYALYDPSYADRRSFGFAIDVGNGWSTLLPSLFLLVAMTTGGVSPLVVGLVGVLFFYQKLYCTCLYFFTYLFNRRYERHPLGRVLAVVGGTNGIWIVFPAIGLYVSVRLIVENRFDLIWS